MGKEIIMPKASKEIKDINKKVGDIILSYRTMSGMSRSSLSQLIGVSQQQLQKYEKGQSAVSVSRLFLLSKALGVDITNFFSEGGELLHKLPIDSDVKQAFKMFGKIKNSKHRSAVKFLIKSLSEDD